MKMSLQQAVFRPLARTLSPLLPSSNRAFYATSTQIRHVQTPIQSVSKDKLGPGPLEPGPDSKTVQTPIQTQRTSQVTPGHTTTGQAPQPPLSGDLRQPRPLLYLSFGLIGVATFSYFYYGYRKEHMERKWAAMQEKAKQNVKNKS